ncbi:hypothetical protein AXF42_Ash012493 [Apostasia shenzhenica]|uniref:Uncharacterized protein n=1 Tax=Apostasia shenzhenica TaxID=1088818 RepID=A0A2I0AQY3_9ASPA|nr:hypothetical protein AXF42_Ash012493 [Apostasia shenzhenica]
MALEVKLMKRWEFDSIGQASSCLYLWFSGTSYERSVLRQHLDSFASIDVFYDAQKDFSSTSADCTVDQVHDDDEDKILEDKVRYCSCRDPSGCSMEKTPPACGPYKKRKIMKKNTEIDERNMVYGEVVCNHMLSFSPRSPDHDNVGLNLEPTIYKDAFLLFKFNDHDLPFKLKDHIISDLRLLTLLEYGLPSWVIFFQSYPVFCQIYRPWMCPLARTLYVIISIVTVVIGFYDLYKNVPLLKTTASRLFGPFFDWIESWEMISRLNYLGTMLFLHNFEKVVKWFLMATKAARSVISVLTKPIAAPLNELVELVSPVWNICFETIDGLSSVVWTLLESSYPVLWSIMEMVIWPFRLIFTTISSIGKFLAKSDVVLFFSSFASLQTYMLLIFHCLLATLILCPILWMFWEICVTPIRFVFTMVNLFGMACLSIYSMVWDTWLSISAIFQFSPTSQATAVASEASMLRSLWNDLFSQVNWITWSKSNISKNNIF